MKKAGKILCLLLAVLCVSTALVGCEKKPGLYNALGIRVSVDDVLCVVIDVGEGKQEYRVPFDLYYGLFDYYHKMIGDGVFEDDDENVVFTTKDEQTAAIKEKIEDEMIEFYAMNALAERYGAGLTDEDYAAFSKNYKEIIKEYLAKKGDTDTLEIPDETAESEYAEFFRRVGVSEEYFRYSYLHELLTSRLKRAIMPDLVAFAERNYYHAKQVLVTYVKGDARSEEEAETKIAKAKAALDAGENIDDVIRRYGSDEMESELYFDTRSQILGSTTSDSVSSFVAYCVSGLAMDQTSDVLIGDYDDELGYFCLIRRLGFDEEMLYGETAVGNQIFRYYDVAKTSTTQHYNEFSEMIDAYKSNCVCYPVNERIYKKINVVSMK